MTGVSAAATPIPGRRTLVVWLAGIAVLLMAATVLLLLMPVSGAAAQCGTIFTAAEDWTGPGGVAAVEAACHDAHTFRLIWLIALGVPGVLFAVAAVVVFRRSSRSTVDITKAGDNSAI